MRINTQTKVALLLALAFTLAVVGSVAAQEGETTPCGGENVAGTVVAVDEETEVVTINTGDGLCTVTLDGEYDHPIVALLGSYFGDVSVEYLTEALETTQGCAIYDPDSETWTWADCDAENAVAVTVIAENDDDTFTITTSAEVTGTVALTGTVTVEHPATAEDLSEALQALSSEWELDADGAVVQPGDEIAAYHEEGLGFGVLVKLYAIAAESQEACDGTEPCGVTVKELVEDFQSGTDLGELLQEYGRPSILGVGHVRGKAGRPPGHTGPSDHAGQPDDDDTSPLGHTGPSDHAGRPDHAGGPSDHAGGPSDHAGGPSDHAGGPSDHAGRPDHAGPKDKRNK